MDEGLLRDLLLVALGFATGVLSGLFGVGGGVISQPGMRLLGIPPLEVIGTALPVIIPGATSGTIRYRHEGLIRWRAFAATVPVGLVAAVGGAALSEVIPGDGHLLQLITAALLGFSAYRMSRPPAQPAPVPAIDNGDAAAEAVDLGATGVPAPAADEGASPVTYGAIGAVSGLLSGLLGIGGGVIMVPAFVQFARMHVKAAIATSLACVGAFAIPGTITHAIQGHVDWRAAAALIIGVIPGARVGAWLTIRANDRRLRIAVGTFLGLTAVIYAAGELNSLLG